MEICEQDLIPRKEVARVWIFVWRVYQGTRVKILNWARVWIYEVKAKVWIVVFPISYVFLFNS